MFANQFKKVKITDIKTLENLTFRALEISDNGEAHEIQINLSLIDSSLIFVQPGLTPPSKVADLSKTFLETPGTKGCTGATIEISQFCTANRSKGYILSNKSIPILNQAYNENKEKFKKEGKPDPFKNITLISDPDFKLAKIIGEEYTQYIDGNTLYKRFSFEANRGNIREIKEHDPSVVPSVMAKQLLEKQKGKNIAL